MEKTKLGISVGLMGALMFLSGDLGYHLREGLHYFSREDWHRVMEFYRLHSEK